MADTSNELTGIPDNAIRVVLAAVVPCEWTDTDPPTCLGFGASRCPGCLGDGIRVAVTDVEVERALLFDSDGAEVMAWAETWTVADIERIKRRAAAYRREVQP